MLKPTNLTFEEASAVPQAGLLALQGLHDKRQLDPGQKVLINGAGGGVGTFAVQIAKTLGVKVTGVDSTRKLDMMRSIGFDQVIDYTKEDFTRNGKHYDLVLDVVVNRSMFDYERALSPTGVLVMMGGSMLRIFQIMLLAPWLSMTGRKKMSVLAHKPNKDLDVMKELIETGKVAPIIDKCYPLSEVPEAFRYFGRGHVQGKVVITV